MRRTVFALTAIVLVAAATGCRMCAHPFDYCGPTFTGGNCEACNPDARAGSILSPTTSDDVGGGHGCPGRGCGPNGGARPLPADDYLLAEAASVQPAAAAPG